MDNKEILKKAIEKAQRNGFYFDKLPNKHPDFDHSFEWLGIDEHINCHSLINIRVDNMTTTWVGLYDVIFSHDFAKAFWGENTETFTKMKYKKSKVEKAKFGAIQYYELDGLDEDSKLPTWQYHLTKMVLKKDPIKYLRKFL